MPLSANVPLSVLDLATVGEGSNPSEALAASVALARRAEALGYARHWVAEHHNMPGIASSSPPVLIAHLAAATTTIRVGSGGVMLPNHAPLVVAEQFGMLEALHPGRVDLGIGRAPGTDAHTAAALRRRPNPLSADEFPEQLGELLAFMRGEFPERHRYREITAVPGLGYEPEVWLLGSSLYSAELAALLGLPFAFAHHFSAAQMLPALDVYRRRFRPSEGLAEPRAMVAAGVICADDDARAGRLAGPSRLSFARLRSGRPGRFPTPDEAAAHRFTASEEAAIEGFVAGHIVGGPDRVGAAIERLLATSGADELMFVTMVHDPADRERSYELIAEIRELTPATADPLAPPVAL